MFYNKNHIVVMKWSSVVDSLEWTEFSFSGGIFKPLYQKSLMSYYKNHLVVIRWSEVVDSLQSTKFSSSGGNFNPLSQKLLMSYYKNNLVVMRVVRGGRLARLDPIFFFRRYFQTSIPKIVDVLLRKPSCGHEMVRGGRLARMNPIFILKRLF